MPIDVSEDGEAANTELGLLLGLTGRLLSGELGERLPALRRDQLVVLGPRDDAWRERFNVGTLAEHGVWVRAAGRGGRRPGRRRTPCHRATPRRTGSTGGGCTSTSTCSTRSSSRRTGLPDFPDEPGGLTWDQLTDLVMALFTRTERRASVAASRSTIRTKTRTTPVPPRSWRSSVTWWPAPRSVASPGDTWPNPSTSTSPPPSRR